MAESSNKLHEKGLSAATVDRHRGIVSLMEELEAVDWYDQRVQAATNPELRALLAHNRDEEKEHAAMVLEWLRRNDACFDAHLRTYLFAKGPILDIEEGDTQSTGKGATNGVAGDGSLGIGSLKGA